MLASDRDRDDELFEDVLLLAGGVLPTLFGELSESTTNKTTTLLETLSVTAQ